MPGDDLRLYFPSDLRILSHWQVPAWQLADAAWLQNMDRRRDALMPLLAHLRRRPGARLPGPAGFFTVCAELWG
jgi:hypothetical protein